MFFKIRFKMMVLFLLFMFLVACQKSNYKKASLQYEKKEYSTIINSYKKIVEKDKSNLNNFPLHRFIIMSYKQLGRLQQGLDYYKTFKNKAVRTYIKGLNLKFIGKYKESINILRIASDMVPTVSVIHYDIGLDYLRLEKHNRAAYSIAHAVKLDPKFADGYYDLGLINFFNRNKLKIGKAFMEYAVSQYSSNSKIKKFDAQVALGKAYEIMKNVKKAISIYENLIDVDFDRSIRAFDIGKLYLKQGKKEKAFAYWEKALQKLGHYSLRGRYFFKQIFAAKEVLVDLTGVPYNFDKYGGKMVYGNEEEIFFYNPSNRSSLYKELRKNRLSDRRYGYEYWIVEFLGYSSRRVPIRKWVQRRGVIETKKFKDGSVLRVSVRRRSRRIYDKSRRERSVIDSKSRVFWFKENCLLGYFKGDKCSQVMRFNITHLLKTVIVDVDGDGQEDIVAIGIDKAGKLQLRVYKSEKGKWIEFVNMETDLSNHNNGFLLTNLDGKKGLEIVKCSGLISYCSVFVQNKGKFVSNDSVYKSFARDFYSKYQFVTQGFLKKEKASGVSSNLFTLYKGYAQGLKMSKQILGL